MAQNFLLDVLEINPNDIAVYHMGKIPMNVNKKVRILVPNFTNDIHRDSTMTKESDYDIAFVREGKYDSGTATADTYYMLNGSAINSLKASSGGINMVNDTPTGSNKNIVSYDPTTGTFYYTLASVNSIYGAIPTISGYNGTITVPRGTSGSLRLNFDDGLLTSIG